MKVRKKLFCIISALCLSFGTFSLTSCDDINSSSVEYYTEGLEFSLWIGGNEYYVTDYIGSDTDVIIPSVYNGKPVTGICGTFASDDFVIEYGDAFQNCSSLTSITIPNSVTYIGYSSFSGCDSLKVITLPFVGKTPYPVDHIILGECYAEELFGYIFGAKRCEENKIYVPSSLEKVYVTNATHIPFASFRCCDSLVNIILPTSLTFIGGFAFDGCNSLKTVYYTGTQEQWNSIVISSVGNKALTNASIIYNYEG